MNIQENDVNLPIETCNNLRNLKMTLDVAIAFYQLAQFYFPFYSLQLGSVFI